MIKRFFDKYYLFWLRQYDWMGSKDFSPYGAISTIVVLLDLNIISLFMIFVGRFMADNVFWFVGGIFVAGLILTEAIDKIYNAKRRDEIRERYKFERLESRARTKVWVVVYIVFTLAFFILAAFILDARIGR